MSEPLRKRKQQKGQVEKGQVEKGLVAAPGRKVSADDDMNNRLFFRLLQAGNIYERQAQRELASSGIQGAVLGELSRAPEQGVSFSSLVDYLAVSRQNLDSVLKRLERAGYVRRVENEADRRIRMVRLTPEGRAAWDDLWRRSLEFYRQGTANIPRTEVAACLETLIKISRALKAVQLERQARGVEPETGPAAEAAASRPRQRKKRKA